MTVSTQTRLVAVTKPVDFDQGRHPRAKIIVIPDRGVTAVRSNLF
jgi:hypothetical protein